MIAATQERELMARIERLERAVAIHNEVHRSLLKSQHPFMPWDAFNRAERRLQEAADMLKPSKGEPP
jgi:hypothetical protein